MLGFIGFVMICLLAALFPTAAALVILGIVTVLTIQHVQDRYGRK